MKEIERTVNSGRKIEIFRIDYQRHLLNAKNIDLLTR